MRRGPCDTDPQAYRVLVELARKAGAGRKVAQAAALSTELARLSRRAIRRARPHLSDRDVDLEFVAVHYGRDLSDRARRYMEEKGL